jgi:hypothetical protein
MKRKWNWRIWAGALVVIAGAVVYQVYCVQVPALRDRPWLNLPIIAIGLVMIGVGVKRAFRQPELYRGKVFGSVVGGLMVLFALFFCFAMFIASHHMLPVTKGAPQVGQIAPDFTLPDSKSQPVQLSALLSAPFAGNGEAGAAVGSGQTAGVLLIFYRGYW